MTKKKPKPETLQVKLWSLLKNHRVVAAIIALLAFALVAVGMSEGLVKPGLDLLHEVWLAVIEALSELPQPATQP